MNNSSNSKIINRIILLVLITLFLLSLFIILNDRIGFANFTQKPTDKHEHIKIIDKNTRWNYLGDGENPEVGNVWVTADYDASAWKEGIGSFIGIDDDNTPAYFFRYEFNVEEDTLDTIKCIEGIVEYSDAVIIYLNEAIIFAGNVPAGGYKSNLDIGVSQFGRHNQINAFHVTDLKSLKDGKNIIGVELHKSSKDRGDVYLNFQELNFSRREHQKTVYDTDGLVLLQGDKENEVRVSWMTTSHDFYILEYIEAKEHKRKGDFSKYGKTLLMGRKKLCDSNLYLNDVEIVRLKDDTEYMYRISKVGSLEASKSYIFKTGKRKGFSFLCLGSSFSFDKELDDLPLDVNQLQKSNLIAGKPDFIITTMKCDNNSNTNLQTQKIFKEFRKPILFKTIPIHNILTYDGEDEYLRQLHQGQFSRRTGNNQGNNFFVYQDCLIININLYDINFNQHKIFMKEAIDKTNRNWIIVVTQKFKANKDAIDMFDELGIDLILDSEEYCTKVRVENDKLFVEEYGIKNIDKVNEYIIEK